MNRRFLLVAILLAGLSAALVYAKISADSGSESAGSSGGDQQVVVARVAIKENTVITDAMLDVKEVPGNALVAGAFTNKEEAIGTITKLPIAVNQQVVSSFVVDTDNPVADASLKVFVPAGKRALSIQASQLINAGGLVLPGDWVDVIWSCCGDTPVISKHLLRNVQVAAVAQTIIASGPATGAQTSGDNGETTTTTSSSNPVAGAEQEPVPDAGTVTILVTPEEAQRIHLAEQNGRFRIDLRGPGDVDTPDTRFTLILDLLPLEELSLLPDTLKPEGYRPE
jgi:pilus assembly protein CpaB